MEISQVTYRIEEITNDLRVHMIASPLDDIVETAIAELDELLIVLNGEL